VAVTVTLRAERRMAGETRIGGGDPNKNPDWAPRPDMDYTDKVCPFTSGVWGAVFPSEQERMHPITHRVERVMAMGQAQGTTYQRCTRRCALFVADPEVKADEKARGSCSIQVGAQGALVAVEGLALLRELHTVMVSAQKSARSLLDKAHAELPKDDDDDTGEG